MMKRAGFWLTTSTLFACGCATLVQHPELVRVVVSFVGIYDMLAVELSPNGAFNVTEFGSVQDEAQYRTLRAYSPYHNVQDGTA